MLFPGLRDLTYRHMDILKLNGISFPSNGDITIDLNPTVVRAHKRSASGGTSTTGMLKYIGPRCRRHLSLESLALQAIHYGNLHCKAADFPAPLLNDLAANSFNSWSFTVVDIISKVIRGNACRMRMVASRISAPMPMPEDPNYLSSLDFVWGDSDSDDEVN